VDNYALTYDIRVLNGGWHGGEFQYKERKEGKKLEII
jgi:hypothetical protein